MCSSTQSTANDTGQNQAISPTTPTYLDNTVIQYHGNKAEILGALYECEQFYRRTGLFRSLIEDGVVSTEKNTIIDSVQNVKFVTGQVPAARKYGFMGPCPDTARRIAIHDAQSRTPGSPQSAFEPLDGMPDEHKYTYTINPWTVREHDKKHDQKFFNSLIQIVGDLDDR